MTPTTELLLFTASRSQLVREVIEPALARDVCVISDRFFDSTTVYQGVARKLDPRMVAQLNTIAVGNCVPHLTFVLDVDEKTAQERMQKPRKPDRMEQEPAEFYERVRQAYRDLAASETKRVVLVNGARDASAIEADIWGAIVKSFPMLETSNIKPQPSNI
jgi:dTMP kinase